MRRVTLLLRLLKVRMHRANVLSFTGILMLLTFIVTMSVGTILDLLPDVRFAPNPEDAGLPMWKLAIMTIAFAPIVETCVFQAIPHFLGKRLGLLRTHRQWILIVVAGLIFGAAHHYSIHYIVSASIMGALMMWGYTTRYKRHAYWSLVLFHACWNASVMLFHYLT